MTTTDRDKQLADIIALRPKLLIRLLSIVKKDYDARLTEHLQKNGYADFKIGDMVLMANISTEGTINNELAKKARITKQAMSKVVKNLEAIGYIITRKHETDNRATVIFLSEKGKQLMIDMFGAVQDIQSYYTTIIGEKDAELLRDVLFKLAVELHPAIVNGTP
ncbi:MarR family transcriptional regulator [Chitinophaga sp.]|uniref:MarR family winged helix-turn-helix transcriptional regulator n=1 Tax=Chitinophaga sp. TaxID=1869181 RepID=UPI0026311E1E|nr:MarR family transcriptional regulator [uncultured Chitinophaga sp.]